MTLALVEKLSDVRDFRKILETTVKEIGENYSSEMCQIILSNPLDTNFTSICEYIANPEEVQDDLPSTTFPLHLEGGGLGLLSVSRQNTLTKEEVDEIRITLANISDILRYAQINDLVQRDTFRSAFMSEISNLMKLPMGLGDALFMVVNILGKALACSRCIFVCCDDMRSDWKSYEYFQRERGDIIAAQQFGFPSKDSAIVSQALLSMVPIISFEGQPNSYKTPVQEEMEFIGVRSQVCVAIRSNIAVHGAIIIQHCDSRHAWTRDEVDIVQSAADTIAEALSQLPEEMKEIAPIMRLHQNDVADTKSMSQQSIQEVRKNLKRTMSHGMIPTANTSKQSAAEQKARAEAPPPPPPPAPVQAPPVVPPQEEEEAAEQVHDLTEYQEDAYDEKSGEDAVQEYVDGGSSWGDDQQSTDWGSEAPAESNEDLGGLAAAIESAGEAQTPPVPAQEAPPSFRGVLGGILGNQRNAGNSVGAWDIETSNEQPPSPPGISGAPEPDSAATAASAASQWGELDSIPTPGGEAAAAHAAGASKWGNLDAIPAPGGPGAAAQAPTRQGGLGQSGLGQSGLGHAQPAAAQGAASAASQWGDLDAIPSPGAPQQPRQAPPAAAAAARGPSKWGDLDAIPAPGKTPAHAQAEAPTDWGQNEPAHNTPMGGGGLSAMMLGKAKASAVTSGPGGLLGALNKGGGMKPPAPPAFVDGPPIQIDEAAAEAKLKQILASSNPTSDYIFATPGIDMRLLGRIDGWVTQVEAKDKYTYGHVRAVAEYSSAVARMMQMSPEEVNSIRLAAIVHDVGKLGLPQQILQKPDEQLNDSELLMTMNHTLDGAKLIEGFPELAPLAPIVLAHHEEFDGNGYPEGLAGEVIPLAARIIHACNAYTEMVSDLVYRQGMNPQEAQNEMMRKAGSTFDPDVVQALITCISQGQVPAKF